MRGERLPVGRAEVELLTSKCFIVCYGCSKSLCKISGGFENGELSEAELDERVAPILMAKKLKLGCK